MKKSLAVLLLVICLSFFLFGFWSGQNINGFLNQMSNPSSAKARANSDELPNHQQNMLLVEVNKLEAEKPQLESIWLILYIKDVPKITWMPLYIASSSGNTGFPDGNIVSGKKFKLGKNKTLAPEFETALRKNDIWWNGYIVTDKQSVSKLIEFLGSAPKSAMIDSENSNENLIAASLLASPVKEKVAQIQSICRLASSLENPLMIKTWIEDSVNLVSDLPRDELLARWIAMAGKQTSLSCEFPSLYIIP
ncbi:MAG: hypothetical protein GYA34_10275 [Chloroflexi bacterium]|nr:hypothetical protein [Chloroflexota bacterium]